MFGGLPLFLLSTSLPHIITQTPHKQQKKVAAWRCFFTITLKSLHWKLRIHVTCEYIYIARRVFAALWLLDWLWRGKRELSLPRCLSRRIFSYLQACLPISRTIYLSIYLMDYLSIHLSHGISIYPSIDLSAARWDYSGTDSKRRDAESLTRRGGLFLPIHLSGRTIYLSIYLSISLSISLSL